MLVLKKRLIAIHPFLGFTSYFLKALLDKISKSVPSYYNEIVGTTSKQDFISSLQNHSIHFLVSRYGNFFP